MITLYDLASKHTGKTWSLSPWKTRYVLNYKGLPYTTRFMEYPDLEPELKKVGIPPSGQKPDGSPYYTSPSITDDGTGARIADSYKIAEYLDKQYPATPKVIPPGTEALQAAFYKQFTELISPTRALFPPKVPALLNPRSAEHYIRARSADFGKPLAQVEPVGDAWVEMFGQVKMAFDTLDGWRSKGSGPFFMGETMTFADIAVASFLQFMRILWGEDSEAWREIKTWNDGRWIEFLGQLEPYASEEN